jgi:hypothetical protein
VGDRPIGWRDRAPSPLTTRPRLIDDQAAMLRVGLAIGLAAFGAMAVIGAFLGGSQAPLAAFAGFLAVALGTAQLIRVG